MKDCTLDDACAIAALPSHHLLLALGFVVVWATGLTLASRGHRPWTEGVALAAGVALGVELLVDGVIPSGAVCTVLSLGLGAWQVGNTGEALRRDMRLPGRRLPFQWLSMAGLLLVPIVSCAMFWHRLNVAAAQHPMDDSWRFVPAILLSFIVGAAAPAATFRSGWPRYAGSAARWGVIAVISVAADVAMTGWL